MLALAAAMFAVVNAHVWTGDAKQPWVEALAVSGNRIAAVGTSADIRKLGADRVIDALGATVTPGFIDSHIHPAIPKRNGYPPVYLRPSASQREFLDRIANYAKNVPRGLWVVASDWDEAQWRGTPPSREALDAAAPENPVWLTRSDLVEGIANSAALRAAGLKPEGAGVVKGAAMMALDRAAFSPSAAEDDRVLDRTMNYYAQQGITSVRDVTNGWGQFFVWERARKSGRLKVRVYCSAPLPAWRTLAEYIAANGRGDAWFRWGLLKGYHIADTDPLASFPLFGPVKPPLRPVALMAGESFYAWISAASRAGLQVAVHGATGGILDIIERVIREQRLKDPRFSSEHDHEFLPGDIERHARLGIIASMQPAFVFEPDNVRIRNTEPARWARMFPYRKLADAGVVMAFGTDGNADPEPPLTVMGIAMAHGALTLEEALRAYTRAGAWATFEESEKGALAPGKLADFVVLDQDLARVAPEQFRNVKVRMTVVDGRVTYPSPGI